jgi:hypothetical protein
VFLSGIMKLGDWMVGLSQSYSEGSQPLVETGVQTQEDAYATVLSATHPFSDRWVLSLGAGQTFRFTDQFSSVRDWSGSTALSYVFDPRIQAGLSLSGGYDSVALGTATTSQTLQGTLSMHPGAKTTLSVSGGAERQQFLGGGTPPTITPVYSLSLNYHLRPSTTISMTAARTTSPSFYANQNSVSTSFSGGVHQGLGRKLSLSLSGGYNTATYTLTSLTPGPPPKYYFGFPSTPTDHQEVRSDSGTFVQVSLGYQFRPSLGGSVSYGYFQNSSSQSAFTFSGAQFGLQLSYHY